MEVITPRFDTGVLARGPLPGLPPALPAIGDLSVQVLRTPAERRWIEPLRQYADVGSEYAVDPGMAALDATKDKLGIVMAILQDDLPIGTIRFIPGGHGLTLTERWWADLARGSELLDANNWEVGRLVMAPEHRRADLLPRCMAMSMMELLEHVDVEHFHASCHLLMARLYRRFGFTTHAKKITPSGQEAALIHGRVAEVARALKVPLQHGHAVLQ
jgi:predicted GNAT family N-acyltransferase